MRVCLRTLCSVVLLLLGAPMFAAVGPAFVTPTLHAQGTEAVITGRVLDSTGNALAGVEVVVRNAATGYTQRGSTRADGRFVFPQLPLGSDYTVTVRRIGFQA